MFWLLTSYMRKTIYFWNILYMSPRPILQPNPQTSPTQPPKDNNNPVKSFLERTWGWKGPNIGVEYPYIQLSDQSMQTVS